ncbi:MAG: alpha-amylase [Deltaproteobacteria bacterium]|nr:alpha-amylase [Deltaproteobacteria bacterium]
MVFPTGPIIYEINTRVWLRDLCRKYRRPVELGTVPLEEWDALASLGIDALWLMGVWERSPRGVRIARNDQGLRKEYALALPDVSPEDVVGSPYSIHRYKVEKRLGGSEGLAHARKMLASRGIGLILDFVPNHVAADHPWVNEHPEFFIEGNGEDLVLAPYEFFVSGGRIFACGRDPFFSPWTDTAQLNAYHPGFRKEAAETLLKIAALCDGVRCDMAMLAVGGVFEKTWMSRAGEAADKEFWEEIISHVRARYPEFLFIAEAYWDLEWELQRQGFDFCYDKRLYNRLVGGKAEDLRLHLCAELDFQRRLIRFIENHDEPRAASAFPGPANRAAAVIMATLPGAKLFHEGQFEGRKIKLPLQLGRRPTEEVDERLCAFYRRLLSVIRSPSFREGAWGLCETIDRPENGTHKNLLSWCLRGHEQRFLVVVNVSHQRSQGLVRVPLVEIKGVRVVLNDLLKSLKYERPGDEMVDRGLSVDLDPYGFHVFEF